MATISGVLAPHKLPNPGLDTVDMAFYCLVRRIAPAATVKLFRLFSPEERNPERERRGGIASRA